MPTDALLSDGSAVHIRQIEPSDADEVVSMHGRFSERTRYLRYFSPYPRIPARDLERFVNVDHRDREALVVVAGGAIVAVGRYERLGPDSPEAEVAFVVEDAFQGKGIAPLLLEHLALAARTAGIAMFVAEVMPANRPMFKVFFDAGYQVSREFDSGVVHLTFPIAPTADSERIARDRERHPGAASIARLLSPSSVAVYGARRDGTGVGATLLRHIEEGGFTGTVRAARPDVPTGSFDLAVIAVPAPAVPDAVADAGGAGAHAVVVVSGQFAELGPDHTRPQRELVTLARSHGMRLVGPNCLGIMNTHPDVSLNATLVPALPAPGRVGVFCQSGFVGVALLSEAIERRLGISTFLSAGNRADVSGNDLLQYWREDPHTDVVLLYLETFGNPRKFARIARAIGRDKPVVVVAAGVPAVGALIAHSGVIRVETVPELLDVGQILATTPLPAGSRVAVVGNDAALVTLAAATCTRAALPVVLTDATPVPPLQRSDVDIVLVVLAPPLPGSTLDDLLGSVARAVEQDGADTPVLAVTVGSPPAGGGAVPTFRTVEEAVRALAHVCSYAQWRRTPPGSTPELSQVDSAAAAAVVARAGSAEELLAAYGVTTGAADLPGVPCSVEVVDDAAFGPVVGFGVGGPATELLGDRAWYVAPLTDVDAAAIVRAPRAAVLLEGHDMSALESLLLRVGRLVDENPGVKRLTLDPVLAHAKGLSIERASVVYGSPEPRPDTGPRHL